MYKKLLFTIITAFMLNACAQTTPKEDSKQFYFCAIVFGYQVSPEGVLEAFEVNPPHECGGGREPIEVGDAWYKSACAFFSTHKHKPTYLETEEPKMKWSVLLINPNRPDVIYPTRTAGSSEKDPVVYVRDSILTENSKVHACENITKKSLE